MARSDEQRQTLSLVPSAEMTLQSQVKAYLGLVYRAGMKEREGAAHIPHSIGEMALADNFADIGMMSLWRRIPYFTEGIILGSRDYCTQKFQEFASCFRRKSSYVRKHRLQALPISEDPPNSLDKSILFELHALRRRR